MRTVRLIKMAIAAFMALFAAAALYISVLILERQEALRQVSRYNVAWSASQAVVELGRFEHRVAAYGLPGSTITKDEIELRFDILANRLQLLDDGEMQAFANADPERKAVVAEFAAAVRDTQPLVPLLDQPGMLERILQRISSLDGKLVQLAAAANRYGADQVADDHRQLLRLHNLFSILATGLIVGGLLLAALLFYHNRLLIRAHAEVKALADNLRSTTVSKQYVDEIVDSMSEGLLVLTEVGRIEKVNSAACRLTGYREDELVGAPLEKLIYPAPRDATNQNRISADALSAVSTIATRGGHMLPVRLSGAMMPTPTESGARLVCIFQDLRDHQRIEAERTQLREELFQAQKMQAIGTLAGGIAHDFNNILGSILGYCALSIEDIPEQHPIYSNLLQIKKAGDRAKTLVQQILAYSRTAEFSLVALDASDIVAEMIDNIGSLRPIGASNVQVLFRRTATVPITGDRTQINQVLVNLYGNALDAIGDAPGTIRIAAEEIDPHTAELGAGADIFDQSVVHVGDGEQRPVRMQLGAFESGRYCRISVSDTGSGMDRQTMARIFEPFFTTKDVGKGTGLGLAAVHGIVRNHNGVIAVESAIGRGSRFEVYIPVTTQGISALPKETPVAAAAGNERILLVDDDPSLLEVTRRTLTRLGYEVMAFVRPHDALIEFQRRPNEWDLLLTDRNMPKLDGERLSQECLKLRPDLPIIMVTGFGEVLDEVRARGLGISEFLYKPVVGPALAAAVRRVLEPVKKREAA